MNRVWRSGGCVQEEEEEEEEEEEVEVLVEEEEGWETISHKIKYIREIFEKCKQV